MVVENVDDRTSASGDVKPSVKDSLFPAAKKQKLENGLLNHVTSGSKNPTSGSSSNSSSSSTPASMKSLVNGDVKPAVNSIQNVSRSTPATPAGSVQAVA